MTVKTFEAKNAGPITVDLAGYNETITVMCEPGITRARVELETDAASGPTVKMLDGLKPNDEGDYLTVHLPKNAGGGMTMVNSFGGNSFSSMVVGSGDVVMSGRGGVISTGGGDSDVHVNGQHIKVRGGRTWVNGVQVSGPGTPTAAGSSADAPAPEDGPMPVRIRAFLPPGSKLIADTYNGDVTASSVGEVRIKTYNGNVKATGLYRDSSLDSYNGNVTVGSDPDAASRPTVHVKTYNGNIRLLDENMRVRPTTRNGHVSYPS